MSTIDCTCAIRKVSRLNKLGMSKVFHGCAVQTMLACIAYLYPDGQINVIVAAFHYINCLYSLIAGLTCSSISILSPIEI